MTSYATTISRDACLAKGADRVFDKTTELEAMLDYLDGLIENCAVDIADPELRLHRESAITG